MPPELDLSHSTPAKIMAVPPRINLRRAASYHNYERNSATSAASSSYSTRLNFQHLLFSPPPSPSLPALVPRRKRSKSQILTSRPSRLVRVTTYFLVFLFACYASTSAYRRAVKFLALHGGSDEFEMVGQDDVPDFPAPIISEDTHGHMKWTVSIPRDYDFPLSLSEYSELTKQCREVSDRTRASHNKSPLSEQALLVEDLPDSYFVDVTDAESTGLLPGAFRGVPPRDTGHFVGAETVHMEGKPVCDSSLTFVLESSDAGIGRSLMTMWTLFALSMEQGRAFFIDDSRWAYGSYTDMFLRPPMSGCRPPPRHHMLPCPAQAKHLVVSSATAQDMLPALLAKHRRKTGKTASPRDEMELARTGYRALFRLVPDDETYVEARVRELRAEAKSPLTWSADAPIIGLHIRHGDRHPFEFQYRDTYIPTEVFLEKAHRLKEDYYRKSGTREPAARRFLTVIASDDPAVHDEPELSDAFCAQERIRLATKEAIEGVSTDPHVLHRFKEEAFGWEKGFFASIFWNLGVARKNNAVSAPNGVDATVDGNEPPPSDISSGETLRLRSLLGRAYMMDLAVLARSSDSVICAVSATGCQLLGAMLGWEQAVEEARWHNVDGEYGWSGITW